MNKNKNIIHGDFVDGSAMAYKKEGLFLINGLMFLDGRVSWFPEYVMGDFYCGLSAIQDTRTRFFGFMNRNGEIVVEPTYFSATDFSEGRAFVLLADTMLINTEGETVKEYDKQYVADEFNDGVAILSLIDNDSGGEEKIDGYVDRNGEFITRPRFRNKILSPNIHLVDDRCSDGMIRICVDEKVGYLNRQGRIVIRPMYENGRRFSCGVAAVQQEGKFGFINKQNQMVIPFEYDDARCFSEGVAAVKQEELWGCIDIHNKLVIRAEFAELLYFKNCMMPACVSECWGFINPLGKWCVPPLFDSISRFHEGIALVRRKNGKWGVIDNHRHELYNDFVGHGQFPQLN